MNVGTQTTFSYREIDSGIFELVMDLAGESMNVLRSDLLSELEQNLDEIEQNKTVKGLIIRSGKPDSFIAGADISMIHKLDDPAKMSELIQVGQKLLKRITDLRFPTAAMIHGPCLGGGLELALACDYRICSNDKLTKIGVPEVQLGLLPGMTGTQNYPV